MVAPSDRAAAVCLRGSGGAYHDGINRFQVARVRFQLDQNTCSFAQREVAPITVVVLDVAGSTLRNFGYGLDYLNGRGSLELAKDCLVWAAEVVGQHVEAATVSHSDHYFSRARAGRKLNRLVDHRHGHVEAFDRELLLAEVGLVHEAFERVDCQQSAQQRALLLWLQRLAVETALNSLTQPGALAVA